MYETGLFFSSVLKELRKMKFVKTRDGKKILSPITKKQREIINACGVAADDVTAWLAKLPV